MDDQELDNLTIIETLKKAPRDPFSFRRIILLLLRMHFSNPANYGETQSFLESYKYSSRDAERTLDVTLDDSYGVNEIKATPSVFVGVGTTQFEKVGRGDEVAWKDDNSALDYAAIAQCPVILKHTSGSSGEALLLAMQSVRFLGAMRRLLMKHMELHDYQVVQAIGEPQLLKDQSERVFMSQTILNIIWQYTWRVSLESLRIKKVELELLADFTDFNK